MLLLKKIFAIINKLIKRGGGMDNEK